ncbi:UL33 [Papiine alphaherpesvirus 2]|uniref:UL33 n=1 Tax=Cercopithecine herpesvirus 16 TaxID=340907 RepID=Q2QBE3_CHV16|nr:DNA packaging protein UL33 [Papiine alphaherpesvirus 2]UYB79380.1 DNA packaging protein UL33 [synthetic construct]ABA29287.1 UL33 [Papiine alphaherpesvirus 2]AHM96009.1 DNA packaging protein UL33 [Papiine alphaherpesvirus 2]UYB79453.1 DNA packaging protein UL33 [synthetic construct]UYB79527.1 DNA packaging protein UL33 [Papiine alphaherpesvirus 2]
MSSGDPRPRTLREAIPDCALLSRSLESLEEGFLSRDEAADAGGADGGAAVWFEDLTPVELEVVFPTTDAKLNYLSRTQRLASLLAYAGDIKAPDAADGGQTRPPPCAHAELLAQKRGRFAAVINRFLDLHQILRG